MEIAGSVDSLMNLLISLIPISYIHALFPMSYFVYLFFFFSHFFFLFRTELSPEI